MTRRIDVGGRQGRGDPLHAARHAEASPVPARLAHLVVAVLAGLAYLAHLVG